MLLRQCGCPAPLPERRQQHPGSPPAPCRDGVTPNPSGSRRVELPSVLAPGGPPLPGLRSAGTPLHSSQLSEIRRRLEKCSESIEMKGCSCSVPQCRAQGSVWGLLLFGVSISRTVMEGELLMTFAADTRLGEMQVCWGTGLGFQVGSGNRRKGPAKRMQEPGGWREASGGRQQPAAGMWAGARPSRSYPGKIERMEGCMCQGIAGAGRGELHGHGSSVVATDGVHLQREQVRVREWSSWQER